jgi:hypothetical protein
MPARAAVAGVRCSATSSSVFSRTVLRNRAATAGDERFKSAPLGVARKSFQTFGEVMDSEQKQAESTEDCYRGGGIH